MQRCNSLLELISIVSEFFGCAALRKEVFDARGGF